MARFAAAVLALLASVAVAQERTTPRNGRAAEVVATAVVAVDWSAPPQQASVAAIPTYLDQVNPSMDRTSPMHDAVFSRMDKLGAKLVRYDRLRVWLSGAASTG